MERLHIIIVPPRILRRLLYFWRICPTLCSGIIYFQFI